MNRRAWAYIWGTYLVAGLLALEAALSWVHPHPDWLAVEVFFGLAIAAQLFKVEAPNHVLFYATPIFYFAGTVLLDPFLLFLLIALPHLAEWIKERWSGSEYLNNWYLQPFNIAMFWIAGRSAQGVLALLHYRAATGTGRELAAIAIAAVLFVLLNHTMLGIALVLARGIPWSESGILDGSTFVSDFVLLCTGSAVAALWMVKPWFVLPALTPIALMYQALMIPRLKREAERDAKTGLFNARHFNGLFISELDRARRFDRPLSVIMADLDHLREINNAHGHLAGDAVLVGVANIIQSTVRDYDIAARFGGEEFALLLPEVDEDQVRVLAERLRHAIESTSFSVSTSAAPLRASMSLGIACFPHDGQTTTDLLHAADTAVYAAKSAGRNCCVCASELPSIEVTSAELRRPLPDVSASPEKAVSRSSEDEQRATDAEEVTVRSWAQPAFVGAVTIGGMAALLVAALTTSGAAPTAIILLTALGVLAELLEVDIFGQGTVSVSVGVAFTAALLTGVEGLACVSGVIAAVHHLRQRRGLNQLHRAAFNWAVHILAGLLVVIALRLHQVPLEARNLTLLVPAALAAAVGYYLVETGFIAGAVGLARRQNVVQVWRRHYQWLLPHYVVLCLMGLALSVTFNELGATGVLIFALPLLMMHFVQRQYVLQNRENMQALQRMNRDLVRAALHDHVTGLGNDRGFQEALRREVRSCAERGVPVALARVNVDEFRAMNEELGRRHGDTILTEAAAMLAAAPALHLAFRLVADDFAVILPNTGVTQAVALLDRFRAHAPGRLGGATISAGVASIGPEDLDADLLNEQAISALNEAKRRGRNVVVSFEDIRDSTLVASWAQAHSVRRLLTERHIEVAFQPIWDIDDGSILGYEALARPDQEYGLVGPQEAFDLARRLGRAQELDTICREVILQQASHLPVSARLFINLAPESLEHDGLSGEALSRKVIEAGLRPENVVFELTERSIVRTDTVVRQAQILRNFGFSFALDDTGAGNAGLGVLSQLQVDYVKVDRSIVNHACTDQAARAVLAGIIALAHEMGAYVIAEGIETVEMLGLVHAMSRSLSGPGSRSGRGVQGYLLGAPSLTLASSDMAARPAPLARYATLDRQIASPFSTLPTGPDPMAVGW